MRELRISLPELVLIAATRGMMGFGIGLLIASRLGRRRRVAVGSTLAAVGALATIPLALAVFRAGRTTAMFQPGATDARPRARAGEQPMTY